MTMPEITKSCTQRAKEINGFSFNRIKMFIGLASDPQLTFRIPLLVEF